MKKLKDLIKYCNVKIIHGGKCPVFTQLESEYKNEFKIPHYSFLYEGKMNETIGVKIADAFENKKHTIQNKSVVAAYEQLGKEVVQQFEFLQKSEMKIQFEPYTGTGEPYKNSYEMLMDLHQYHMYFFKTDNGFGETNCNEDNIMLCKTGHFVNDYELTINDLFRIVHDVFGHAAYGYSFGPIGEDLAWMTHCKMFTPLARAALTTETRGQNCWVNYGKHLRRETGEVFRKNDKGWLAPEKRPFAEQKMVLLPEEISGVKVIEEGNNIKVTTVKNWNPFLNVIYA